MPPASLDAFLGSFETPLALDLRFAGVPVRVLTNAVEIRDALRRYWAPWVSGGELAPASTVRLVQAAAPEADGLVTVAREDGKAPKEAVRDVEGGRLVRKLATGVLMGLRGPDAFAVGDLVRHLNQGINLVNNRYARIVRERGGHLLLHASAVARDGRAVALAGPPGAGKSTSALHLVEHGLRFVSNDRLLVRAGGDVEALGYPKQPRVNPGTLLHHPRLSRLLAPDDRAALAALPSADLWKLERKCDVDLEAIYGAGTFELQATLAGLVVLTWRPSGTGLAVRTLDRGEALECLPLIRKDLGAFDPGRRTRASAVREVLAYSALFARIPVVEVSGRVSFAALAPIVEDLMATSSATAAPMGSGSA